MPRIMAIDPGPSTGLALWDTDGAPYATTLQRAEAEDFIVERLDRDRPTVDVVVIEKFIISQATAKKSRDGAVSIELIGLTRYLTRVAEVPLVEQPPSDAKMFSTDEKLKRIGWYVPGPDHARDALRHLLVHAAEHGLVSVQSLLPDK